jgi:hypothetical protein
MSNKTKIWVPLIIVNIVLAHALVLLLVPVSSHGFKNFIRPWRFWPPEAEYVASWDRDLTENEIDVLIESLGDQMHLEPVLVLVHHGDEQAVLDALLLATEDDEYIRSIGAEVALYKIGIEKEERWEYIMNLLRTGGLEENELYILDIDPFALPQDDPSVHISFVAGVTIQHTGFALEWTLNPVEDSGRIPDLLKLLESDSPTVKYSAFRILRVFLDDNDVALALEEIVEKEPDPDMGYIMQKFLDQHHSKNYLKTYEDWVIHNRNRFKLSMVLILLIAAGSVGYGIYLSRKPNR